MLPSLRPTRRCQRWEKASSCYSPPKDCFVTHFDRESEPSCEEISSWNAPERKALSGCFRGCPYWHRLRLFICLVCLSKMIICLYRAAGLFLTLSLPLQL